MVVNARFLTRRITGLERYAIEISRQLKQIRPSLTFVASRDVIHQPIAKELEVELYGRLTGHLWEQIELPLFLRRKRYPTLLSLMNTGPIRYRNQVVVIHDLAFLRNPAWFSWCAAAWFKFLVPSVVRVSPIIVTQSAFTKNELVELLDVSEEKIHVVYPGVSEGFRKRANVRQKNPSGAIVLAVSTLEPRKNLERLIDAFRLLERKDATLIIVGGDNPLVFGKSRWKDGHHPDPAVQFMGYVTDAELADLYQKADVFVSVSLYEGFGFPPLEAFANGCRILVSDIPSHREIFGESAAYVNPLDTAGIAQKLNSLLETRDVASGTEIEAILSKFSWRRAAEDLLRIADVAAKVS